MLKPVLRIRTIFFRIPDFSNRLGPDPDPHSYKISTIFFQQEMFAPKKDKTLFRGKKLTYIYGNSKNS
jgi:hypothetical protein